MAEPEVQSKLNQMLKNIRLFKHEMEVVYFLVEVCKLIEHGDQERRDKYQIIRFYRDWAVHTEKSRSFKGIKTVLKDLYSSCKLHVERWPESYYPKKLKDFLYLTDLQCEIISLSREFHIDTFMISNKDCWLSFVKKLTSILNEQPIHNIPDSEIMGIEIRNANAHSAQIRVYFKHPIKDRDREDVYFVELNNGFGF